MNINKILLTPVFTSIILALIIGCLSAVLIILGLLMASVILTSGSDTPIIQIIARLAASCIMVYVGLYGVFWSITDIQKRMKK